MPELWDPKDKQSYRLYIPLSELKKDVHYRQGVDCSDCHGGNPESTGVLQAHSAEDHFRGKLADIMAVRCATATKASSRTCERASTARQD